MIIDLLNSIYKPCANELSRRNDLRWNKKGWFKASPSIPEKGSMAVRTYMLPASPVDCRLYMDGKLVYEHTYFGAQGAIDKVKFVTPDGNTWTWVEGQVAAGVGQRNKHPATIEVTRPDGRVSSDPFVWKSSPVGTEGLELSHEYRAARDLMVDLKNQALLIKIGKRRHGDGYNDHGPNWCGKRGDWVKIYVIAPQPD